MSGQEQPRFCLIQRNQVCKATRQTAPHFEHDFLPNAFITMISDVLLRALQADATVFLIKR